MAEERQRLRAEAYDISSNYNSFLSSGGGERSPLFFESSIFASFRDIVKFVPSPFRFEIVELFSKGRNCFKYASESHVSIARLLIPLHSFIRGILIPLPF